MEFVSKNMNYIFNVEYFEHVDFDKLGSEANEKLIKEQNNQSCAFDFSDADTPIAQWQEIEGYQNFPLYTLYPGLLVGSGNPHEIAVAGAIKCGFTFDYVSGLPYITGSALKGMLRAYFPGDTKEEEKNKEFYELINGLLGKEVDVLALKEDMFVNNDIFLGAFPVLGTEKNIMEMEFITPHKSKFKDPNPISLVKVKPGVCFAFSFVLSDFKEKESGKVIVSAAEKLALCKELLLLMGIGAKTNIGFGRFSEDKPQANVLVPRESRNFDGPRNQGQKKAFDGKQTASGQGSGMEPRCRTKGCKNAAGKRADGSFFAYCRECNQKYREAQKGNC